MAIFKLSYNYMKMISLQNVMGKIINDIITLFLFNILKLLCSHFCIFILFSYINVCIEWFGESHLRAAVYKLTESWIKHFSFLVHTYAFYSCTSCLRQSTGQKSRSMWRFEIQHILSSNSYITTIFP